MFKFISAGAGTGKTTFIINQIKLLLNKNKKILVITYTNSCVEEMIERLKKNHIPLDHIHICTFHGLCNKFMNSNKIFMDNSSLPIISNYLNIQLPNEFTNFYNYFLSHTPLDYEDYKKKLKEIFPGDKKTEPLTNLEDYFRDDGVLRKKIPEYIKNKEEWGKNLLVVKGHFNYLNYTYNLLYLKIFEKIEEARKILNLYTFHHMILETLNNISEFTMKVWESYDNIFIDEVQDLSHVQFKIIENLASEMVFLENKNITIVGDIHQSIFSFQGANEVNFNNFINYIKSIPSINYEEISLNNTYRFGGDILATVNKHFYFHTSSKKEGEIEVLPLCKNNNELINTIKTEINKLVKTYENNLENLNILILFHKRSSLVYELEKLLEENNLFITIHRKIFNTQDLLVNFFNFIEFLITKNNRLLCEFLLGGTIIICEPDFTNFMKSLNNNYDNLYGQLVNKFNSEEINLLKILYNKENLSVKEFFHIFTGSVLEENFYRSYGKDSILFIDNLKKSTEFLDLLLVDILYLKNEDLWFFQKGNVEFSTIHNGKGGEADYVFIIDGNEGVNKNRLFLVDNFPIYNFFMTEEYFSNSKEFKNLLYVALTRSKKKVYIIGKGLSVKKNSLYDILKKNS
jgi:superfamily I DNA/RNA helicase